MKDFRFIGLAVAAGLIAATALCSNGSSEGLTCDAMDVNGDSLALVQADWQIDSMDGFVLKRHAFKDTLLFGAPQFVAMIEIPPQSPRKLAFCYEPKRTNTSTQVRKHGAVAGVNGSFFDMQLHNPICYLRIDGVECGENTPGVDTVNRKYYQYGSMSLTDGRPRIFRTGAPRNWERGLMERDVMTAGPLLLLGGREEPQRVEKSFVGQRHNRTAIGVREDGTVLLLVVDGRMRQSAGMSLVELQRTLRWLGCDDALNLDGGGSTTLYVDGAHPAALHRPCGIVNHPSDNGRYDAQGERMVSSCVLVM